MAAVIEAVFGRNITLVYNALDLQTIDRNKLRGIIPDIAPTVMDTPEMVVAVYPPSPWLIQIGDRRIRINVAAEIEGLGDFPLWEYAIKCNELIPADKASIFAYGYNFDFGVRFQDSAPQNVLISKFVLNRPALEDTLQGTLVSYLPRMVFRTGDLQYDIVFEPMNDVQMKIHGNAHFQYAGIQLPSLEGLKSSYIAQYEHLRNVIMKLLND
ncbi:MAG: hypothetical protein KKC71_03905 [Chloroflexi bacterium]|nr:hypothetical protein [Chloroflexota bacterium]